MSVVVKVDSSRMVVVDVDVEVGFDAGFDDVPIIDEVVVEGRVAEEVLVVANDDEEGIPVVCGGILVFGDDDGSNVAVDP